MPIRKNRLIYILLIVIVIIINGYLFHRYYKPDIALFGDQEQYKSIAMAIANFKSTYNSGGIDYDIAMQVTPGYPVFLAAIYKIFSSNDLYVYLAQIVLNILSIIMFYRIIVNYCSQKIAFIASVSLAFYYPIWASNYQIMMEVPTIFLLIVILFYINKSIQDSFGNKLIYIIGILFAILVMVNNRFVVHFAFLQLFFLLKFIQSRGKQILRFVIITSVIMMFVLGAWHTRQYIVFHKLVVFAPYRLANEPDSLKQEKLTQFKSYQDLKTDLTQTGYSEFTKETVARSFTIEKYNKLKVVYEARHKSFINNAVSRALYFWKVYNFDYSNLPASDTRVEPPYSPAKNLINIVFLLPMFILMFVGIFFALKNKEIFFQLLTILIFAHILLHSVIHYIPRYRLTIIPVIFLLGCYGFSQLIRMFHLTKNQL
jgi:hypothetical protein